MVWSQSNIKNIFTEIVLMSKLTSLTVAIVVTPRSLEDIVDPVILESMAWISDILELILVDIVDSLVPAATKVVF